MLHLATYFLGRWTFTRTIHDGADGVHQTSHASGNATFLEMGEHLLQYSESGKLLLAQATPVDQATSTTHAITFSRCFHYQIEKDHVQVLFADGAQVGQLYQSYRLDHQLQQLMATTVHQCVLDEYDSQYYLISVDRFDMDTQILGPKKNQRLHTCYQRMA